MPSSDTSGADAPSGWVVPERREWLTAAIGCVPVAALGIALSVSRVLLMLILVASAVVGARVEIKARRLERFDATRLMILQSASLEPLMHTVRRTILVPALLTPIAVAGFWLTVAASVAGGLAAGLAVGFCYRVVLYRRIERKRGAIFVTTAPAGLFRKKDGLTLYLLARSQSPDESG